MSERERDNDHMSVIYVDKQNFPPPTPFPFRESVRSWRVSFGDSYRDPKELEVQSMQRLLEHISKVQIFSDVVDCTLAIWNP